MKAFGAQNKTISSIIAFETDIPKLEDYDLLVKVEAVSVNPVDTKVRQSIDE